MVSRCVLNLLGKAKCLLECAVDDAEAVNL